jgi:signal transduction histidine kinase
LNQYLLVPYSTRRALLIARVVVAGAVLLVARPGPPRIIAAAYLLFSLAAFALPWLQRPPLSRLALAADATTPFAGDWYGDPSGAFLLQLWFFYLAASLVLLHGWRDTIITVTAWWGLAALLLRPDLTVALHLGALAVVATALKYQFEERLQRLSKQSVMSRAEAMSARESERDRIANDFHDGPLQSYMSLQMRLEVARRLLERDHEKGMAELQQLQEFWQAQVADLRNFVNVIRGRNEPAPPDLGVALSYLTEAFEKESGIEVKYEPKADFSRLDGMAAVEILSLVRESLHNIHKHAGATHVELKLIDSNGALEIDIEDDGHGFPFTGTYTLEELDALNRGPAAVRRRVHNLEGAMRLETSPGEGARLRIRIPVEQSS